MRRAFPLILALAGCVDLEPLDPGECGNGVVDPGEDCDRFAAEGQECGASGEGARSCRLLCDVAACPTGWGCRQDGICHHATGRYRELGDPLALAADDFALGDVDGDELTDLVAESGAALRVLFGDGDGGFGDTLVREVAQPLTGRPVSDRPVTGHLDDDQRTDIALPSREGVSLLTGQADRTLRVVPVVAAFEALQDWLVPIQSHGVGPEDVLFGVDLIDGDDAILEVSLITVPDLDVVRRFLDPVLREPAPGSRLPVLDDDGDGDDEVLIAFAADGSLQRCWSDDGLGLQFAVPLCQVLELGALPFGGSAIFADANGDGIDDVIALVDGGSIAVLAGDGTGAYAAAAVDERLTAIGMPLAAGDLDDDGDTDWVVPDGIYLGQAGPPDPVFPFEEPIHEALLLWSSGGDASDPYPDVVVADEGRVGFLINRGEGGLTPRWISTEGRPFSLRAGSFDGDDIEDVAFAEDHAIGDDALVILFGQGGTYPVDPVRIAGIPSIERLETGLMRNSSGRFDGATDILVSSAAEPGAPHPLSLFEGAADRNLDAPLAPTVQNIPHVPERAFIGRFVAGAGPGGDVVMVERDDTGTTASTRVWVAVAQADGRIRKDGVAWFETPALGCSSPWTAGDRDGDGTSELLAFDCDGVLHELHFELLAPEPLRLREGDLSSLDLQGASRLDVEDLDGDGREDVVAASETIIEIVWAADGGISRLPARAIARVSADADGAPELAVLTEDGVFLSARDDGTVTMPDEPVSRVGGTRVAVADLDGDELDDLLIGDGTTVTALVAVSHLAVDPQ